MVITLYLNCLLGKYTFLYISHSDVLMLEVPKILKKSGMDENILKKNK